ncbi:hypothetical protein ACHAXT_008379 [Thalassiosira profunda]
MAPSTSIGSDGGRRRNDRRRRRGGEVSASVHQRARLLAPAVVPWLLAAASAQATSPRLRGHTIISLEKSTSEHINTSRGKPPQPPGRRLRTVQNYCGATWGDANGSCLHPCPDGEATFCPSGMQCFADLASCPSMEVLDPWETGEAPVQPGSLGGGGGGYGAAGGSSSSGGLPFQQGAAVPAHCPSNTNSVNVGYYQSWAKYRSPDCNQQYASQIPVAEFGYTHLVYSFAGISHAGTLEPYNGVAEETSLYEEFNGLKSDNAGLKTLIAVGGWNLQQSLFGKAASTPGGRKKFAQSAVGFLQQHGFDGLDLDWEYPVSRQGSPEDYGNYPLLVKAIREEMDASGMEYLLTIAIPANPQKLKEGFDLRELSKHVDWFHLMSYDIHGSWDDVAGSNTDMAYIANTIENLILSQGVSPEQLVFGMASYGRSMQLTDPECKTVGCPIDGAGIEGCSGEMGFSPHFELMEKYVYPQNYESMLINEETMSMEMIVEGDVFVSLDVGVTFGLKREYYLSQCLRGQMWWATDMIKDPPFAGSSLAISSGQAPSPAVSNNLPTAFDYDLNTAPGVLNDDQYCADTTGQALAPIEDCSGFVFCNNGRMSGSITHCSPGLIFDANNGICNWPSETNICGFEFCPGKRTGWVPFEECSSFYYCKSGKIDGDIDKCPDGTLFDVKAGICNWASMMVCHPMPTPNPTFASVAAPGAANVVVAPAPGPPPPPMTYATVQETYGTVGATAANVLGAGLAKKPATLGSSFASTDQTAQAHIAGRSNSAFEDGTARLHFKPTDDAYVQLDMPSENFNDRFIVVDNDLRFDGLLRFYVQGLEGRRVRQVKLRLYVANQSTFGGHVYRCKNDWHEDVVTWDNAPSIVGGQPLATIHSATLADWIEIDVTDLVAGDGPVSLRIASDSSDNVMYSSKENPDKNAPELLVDVESVTAEDVDVQARDAPTVMNQFKIGCTDDAFVIQQAPGTNFGSDKSLKVDMDSDMKAYLRFDLSRVNVAAVESATLRLFATDSSQSGGLFVAVTNSYWDEGEITWKNAPVPDGMVLGVVDDVVEGNWVELDITKAIKESGAFTICILGQHEDRVVYSSKDGVHSPEILLTLTETVPLVSQAGTVVELQPTDDATIALQNPNANYGTDKELRTDARDGMRNILLRFDASEIPRGEVKSAILRIFAENEDPAFGGTFVEVADTDWDERSVTWNNAPSGDGKVLGSLMEVEYGSWYDVDVTTAIVGQQPVAFRVSSPSTGVAVYSSRQRGDRSPRLIVQYSPPDPLPKGFDVYIPTNDASILMDKPRDNFGRSDQLKVDGHGGYYNSLLRFDLSSVEIGTVEEAKLRLYVVDGCPSGGTVVTTLDTNWSQHKVTWETAPDADGVIVGMLGEATAYQWVELDLAKIVNDLGGKPLSIRIAPSHGFRCAYSSSEDRLGHLPRLLIKSDIFKGME